ncbi:MAG: glycosyltransferase [Acidobacteriota bacterium]
MIPLLLTLGTTALLAWIYLAFLHGGYWRADQRLENQVGELTDWPAVTVVVPARNEADVIERCLASLLGQDYPGPLVVVLVDDHSDDGTGDRVRDLAAGHPRGSLLRVRRAAALEPGWTGKMWAVHSGVEIAGEEMPEAEYLLLTDADVEHDPTNLRRLVAKAEGEGLSLVSLMVRLHCRRGWERLLIPAFVYFFQQLYPFSRVNDSSSRTAGAAGGCMLVRRQALERAGGIAAIRGEVIDDCALARQLKPQGPIWLGLTETEHSIRPYDGLPDIWSMVARTAYTQLQYSPWLLAGTVLGLVLVYLAPPLLALTWPLHGCWGTAGLGLAGWILMAWTFIPTLRLYRRSLAWALALPVAGLLYLGMTLDSARRYWRGQGGSWKGRAAAALS